MARPCGKCENTGTGFAGEPCECPAGREIREAHVRAVYRERIGQIVEGAHDCECSACDIRAAMSAGFPLSAAHLLMSAHDVPALDPFLPLPKGPDGWPADWPEWTAYHSAHGIECEGCGAFNYPDAPGADAPESCGNCLAALPRRCPGCEYVGPCTTCPHCIRRTVVGGGA